MCRSGYLHLGFREHLVEGRREMPSDLAVGPTGRVKVLTYSHLITTLAANRHIQGEAALYPEASKGW